MQIKKYEDLISLKIDLENILGLKEPDKEDKKTIFKINNFVTIKKTSGKNIGS